MRGKLFLLCIVVLSVSFIVSCSSENEPTDTSKVESVYGKLPSSVTEQSMNAKLYTDQATYQTNESVTLQLENFGPAGLFFGTPYELERNEDGTWITLNSEMDFDAIGIQLAPSDIYEQSIDLSQVSPGQYRIVKSFSGEGTGLEATLAAEFEIME